MDPVRFNPDDVVKWFNAIRNLDEPYRTRALEAFWSGQIQSKCWLVETIQEYLEPGSNIYIFGGWIGVLASILYQSNGGKIASITNVDIDPWCQTVALDVCQGHSNFIHTTADMGEYGYDFDRAPGLIINTSTEHVDQSTYDKWWDRIPSGCPVAIQGNNFTGCGEHIRCSNTLKEFIRMNHAQGAIFTGSLDANLYERWMAIFRK